MKEKDYSCNNGKLSQGTDSDITRIDYHIHSEFSSDSAAKMDDIIKKAIKKGYSDIAFSDHFDLMPAEIAYYGVPSYYQFSKSIDKMKEKYPQINILRGVEVGEYHRCYETVDAILKTNPPDIKIAAIHVLPKESSADGKENSNISLPLKDEVNEDLIRLYYIENLKLTRHGNFDILAHLGVYKRYLKEHPDESCAVDIITEIFNNVIEKDIILEINLSGLRKTLNSIIPDIKYLEKFRNMGGKLISIGSDTHHVNDFNKFYRETCSLLRQIGFDYIVRKNTKGWEHIMI